MPVRLQILPPRFSTFARPLRRLLRLLGITAGNWSISLVRDPEMSALHARTMNDPSTTDVLTFDLRDSAGKNRKSKIENRKSLDLDTILCLDEARRRAKELRHPVDHELLLYALHSLLHVQGYDDVTPGEFAHMHAREDQLLTAIGIGAVYQKRKTQNAKRKPPFPNRKAKSENRKSRRAS